MTTTIQDTLTYADGSNANGQVVVSWPAFQWNGTPVAGGMQIYQIVDGVIDIDLYSNVNALPTGVYYTAAYELDEGARYEEYWVIPNVPTVTLGQIKAAPPPAPSVMINAAQLSSAGATNGQFLGWNGNRWVPMYCTTLNISPNTIGMVLTAQPGSDITVTGSPATLGNNLQVNIPDAGPTSRGVVNTGPQSIAGSKTFLNQAYFSTLATFQPSTVAVNTGWGNIGFSSSNLFTISGSVFLTSPDGSLTTIQAHGGIFAHVDLSPGGNSPSLPTGPVSQECILFPYGPTGANYRAIGVDQAGNLWLGANQNPLAAAYLRPDAAWVANWIDLSPYQHPITAGTEATPSQASIVIYNNGSQWSGIGYDSSMRMWFRCGPNANGTYYYLSAGGTWSTSYYLNNVLVGIRPGLNIVAASGIEISADDNPSGWVDVVFSAEFVDPTAALGDLIVRGTTAPSRLGVGINGQVLTSDSTMPLGIAWETPEAGGVGSVFGRTGAVVAQAGDYSASQVTNAVSTLGSYADPAWITSLSWSKIQGAPPVGMADPTTTLGDLIVRGSSATTRLGVGTNGQVLTADSTQLLGVAWETPTGAVSSVFGRSGAVVATAGDYTVAQITGAVPNTVQVLAGAGLSGGGALTGNVTLSAVPMGASGLSHAAGIVPDPGSTAGATRYLREDATWAVPSGTGVSSVFGRSGAVVASSGDYTVAQITGAVANTVQVIAGSGLSGGGALTASVTLSAIPMGASGSSHAAGMVPDPGSTLGATRYLREDATWAVPSGTGGGMTDPTTTLGDIIVRGSAATTRLGVGTNGQVLTADSSKTLGLAWETPTGGGGGYWQGGSGGAIYYNGGNVGIGTASPSYPLHVQTSGQTIASFQSTSPGYTMVLLGSASNEEMWLNWQNAGVTKWWLGNDGTAANEFQLTADGSTLILNITQSGFVGIGTQSDPAYKLDVAGDINSAGAYRVNGTPIVTGVSSVFGRTGAVVAASGDYTAAQVTGAVPNTVQVIAGAGLSGGGALTASVTLTAVAMVASGSSHKAGIVPDPGATAGTTRFLREDATWVVPAGAVASVFGRTGAVVASTGDYTAAQITNCQSPWLQNVSAASYNLNSVGYLGVGAPSQSSVMIYVQVAGTANGFTITGSSGLISCMLSNSSTTGYTALFVAGDTAQGGIRTYGSAYGSGYNNLVTIFNNTADITFAAPTERMRVAASGRVGIGTSTPGYVLDVAGSINTSGSYLINGTPITSAMQTPWLQTVNAAGWSLSSVAAIGIGVAASSGIGLYMTSSLTYGIYQTAPTTSASSVIYLANSSGNVLWFGMYGSAASSFPNTAAFQSNVSMVFANNGGNTILMLTQAQNVGIKNGTPSYPLDVIGDVNVSGTYRINGTPIATSQTPWTQNVSAAGYNLTGAGFLSINGSGSPVLTVISNSTSYPMVEVFNSNSAGVSSIGLESDLGYWAYWNFWNSAYATASLQSVITFGTPNNIPIWIQQNNATRMAVNSSGVGFNGITVPAYSIDVNGDIQITGTYRAASGANLTFACATTQVMTITTSGNVGIGNNAATAPDSVTQRLQAIVGSTTTAGGYSGVTIANYSTTLTAGEQGALIFANYGIAATEKRLAIVQGIWSGANNSGGLAFWTMNAGTVTQQMIITQAGYVGISTGSPVALFSLGPGAGIKQLIYDATSTSANYNMGFGVNLVSASAEFSLMMGYGTGTNTIFRIVKPNSVWPYSGYTSLMCVLGSGYVGIGVTTPTYLLQLNADSAGKPSTNTWTIVSDERVKRNVRPFEQGLETLTRFRPIAYEYNGEADTPEGLPGVGLIAQEAAEVYEPFIRKVPGEIAGQRTDVLWTNTSDLAWMMVNALKEIDGRLKKLEEKLCPSITPNPMRS